MLHKLLLVVYYQVAVVVATKNKVVKVHLKEHIQIIKVVMVNQVHCFKVVMLLMDVRQNPTLKKVEEVEAATMAVAAVHQDLEKVVKQVMQVAVEEVVHFMDILKSHQVLLVLQAIQKVVVKVVALQKLVTLLKQEKVVV